MTASRKLGIAAICGALLATLPATALAVFPGKNGQILFVSGRADGDANADIYIIDGPNDLTLDGPIDLITGQHRHPNWGPDARSIVFASRVPDASCGMGANDEDLFFRDPLGGTSIFEESANCVLEDHPTFSPDGKKIAYESEVTNGSGQKDILIANADGSGTPQNFTNTSLFTEETPVWSPDGEFIYYARRPNAGTETDIFEHPVDGGGPLSVPQLISAANEFQPEISPDGKQLCYTRGAFGSPEADIYVANINGAGDPFELSPPDAGGMPVSGDADYDCGWSPDGTTISWTRGTFGGGQLQFAPSDDSGPIDAYGNNSGTFDGNVDWARKPERCGRKPATIYGSLADDRIRGTNGNDVIVTFAGKDRVRARGGKDRVCTGKGADVAKGGDGRDKLFTGEGKDTLNGGKARDFCDGGPGKDTQKNCERKKNI
jgi:Tol biopolymer transport system component